jgi:hypothetical protein
MKKSKIQFCGRRGFALVVTLSLMILLTVIAVGLLTLSTISLRSSSQGEAMQAARANARMALMLAIGDLQKQLGPDTRISVTADQMGTGTVTASNTSKHFTGAYKSWDASAVERPASPEFLQWFVSGNPADLRNRDWGKTPVTGDSIDLVGVNSAGTGGDLVKVPLITQTLPNNKKNQIGWWVSDLGTKGLIGKAKEKPVSDLAAVRADLQTMPAYQIGAVTVGADQPYQAVDLNSEALDRVVSLSNSTLLTGKPTAARGLIHDLTAFNRGLLTNVRTGGFRKDLSMYLERDAASMPSEALYTAGAKKGINLSELWVYYNLHKELKKGSGFTYTTGGALPSSVSYLQVEGSLANARTDNEFYYKQPALVQYQTLLSFHARPGKDAAGNAGKFLQIVVDPVVTFWNPLDVPVVVTPAYNSIKFWQLPYDVRIRMGALDTTVSLQMLLGGANTYNYLTLIAGKAQPVVLKPGEVLMMSQGPNTPIYQSQVGISKNFIDAVAGWNFGGGIAFDMVDKNKQPIFSKVNDTVRYEVTPNSVTSTGSQIWSLTHHDVHYKEDRASRGESMWLSGVSIDYIFGQPFTMSPKVPKPASSRITAASRPDVFGKIPPASTRTLTMDQLNGSKEPFMLFSFKVKTEIGAERPGKFLARFNPAAIITDFSDLSPQELDVVPFDISIHPVNSFRTPLLEVSPNGNGYFGGGMNAQDGNSFVSTHSVPRAPLYSLAALQHAFANGFDAQAPKDDATVNVGRQPLLPQISHAIGNSFAPSVIAADKTEGSLSGPRPLADHSYLANRALWDDWFFSSIAPQDSAAFTIKRSQQQVAKEFFEGVKPLPLHRYRPALGGATSMQALAAIFSGSNPQPEAHLKSASLLEVEGMFNVNSTSVQAWKTVLGALKNRDSVSRDLNGAEIASPNSDTPVAGLNSPQNLRLDATQAVDVKDASQWVGRRSLSDPEIDALAQAIVKQVRKRGPFLSLADFVNRRITSDEELAVSGAVQSALDAADVPINKPFRDASRKVADTSRYIFPKAEEGASATGIPGIVKQADILTPIAPYLSARSDSFLVRAAGRVTDAAGKVIATAYCEAVIQRGTAFVDSTNAPETATALITATNTQFGRRFQIISFRWLNSSEI